MIWWLRSPLMAEYMPRIMRGISFRELRLPQ
jgi:hypothetical protein